MKTKRGIGICQLLIVFFLLVVYDCKKDLSNTIIHIGKDQDSNYFSIQLIGNQAWITRNLRNFRYINGNRIGTTTPSTLDISDQYAPKYQWPYDGDETNVEIYGRLYTWYAVDDPRRLCPAGFHVPTDEEWTALVFLAGGENVGGGKLKETGTILWLEPNTGATNESFFTALPGGYRFDYGRFIDIGFSGFWWSSTEASESAAYGWGLFSNNNQITRFIFPKGSGLSVRCIKDN